MSLDEMRIIDAFPLVNGTDIPPGLKLRSSSYYVEHGGGQENVLMTWLSGSLSSMTGSWFGERLRRFRQEGRSHVGVVMDLVTGLSCEAAYRLAESALTFQSVGGELLLFAPPTWMRPSLRSAGALHLIAEETRLEDRLWRLAFSRAAGGLPARSAGSCGADRVVLAGGASLVVACATARRASSEPSAARRS